MLDRRRFNAVLAGTAGWVALGPIGTAGAQRQSRGAVYASVDARLYRIRQDGNTLIREARPLILPAQVQEAWPHPSGRYFYVASSDERTSTRPVRHHYLNAFSVDSSGALRPFGGAVQLAHRPIYITVDHRGEYLISAYSGPSGMSVHRLNTDGSIGDHIEQHARLDVGFYAHAVRVMPSNRAVLLITRGNEPVPGMRTEDPGALYIYGFENRPADQQTVRGAQPGLGIPPSARRLSSFWKMGLRRFGSPKPASHLQHSSQRQAFGRACVRQHHVGLAINIERGADDVVDSHASDEWQDLVRRESGPGHRSVSGRESSEWHRKHDRGILD